MSENGKQAGTPRPRGFTAETMKRPFPLRSRAAVVVATAICSSLLVAALFQLGESHLSKERDKSVLRDKEALSAALDVTVRDHKRKLAGLLSKLDAGTLTQTRFHHLAQMHPQAWPEVTRISWLRKDFEVRVAVPAPPDGQTVRAKTPLPELDVWYQAALDAREPVCTAVFENEDGRPSYKVIAAILEDNRPAGFFVISASLDKLLANYIHDNLLRDYAFAPVSGSREFAAHGTNERPLDERLAREIDLGSSIPGLTLRMVPYATGFARYRMPLEAAAILAASGLSLLICVLVWNTRERRRIQEELCLSRKELHDLASHLQLSAEKERSVMARDIHDELGGAMTIMKVGLAGLARPAPEANGRDRASLLARVRALDEVVDSTLKWGRRAASNLRPQILDDFGIVAALEWQAAEFQKRIGIRCLTEISSDDIPLDREQSTVVFRICQEALTNVTRHAQATRVCISLNVDCGTLELAVRDNGVGISEKEKALSLSMGLVGMRERANAVGGELRLAGEPGEGTTVTLQIPNAVRDETEVRADMMRPLS